MIHCKHGDIVLVHLGPRSSSAANGMTQPALIISSETVNANLQTIIVCPIIDAKNVAQSRMGATLIPKEMLGCETNRLVLSFHIMTVSKDRVLKRLGSLPPNYLHQIKESLQAVLSLD
ncbi:MAG: type II toxin-antitoxin system PemK/MazF family toxin [bacterium]